MAVYSGDRSSDFWRRINNLPIERFNIVHGPAVLLQDMEAKVLRWLESEESMAQIERALANAELRRKGKVPRPGDRKGKRSAR